MSRGISIDFRSLSYSPWKRSCSSPRVCILRNNLSLDFSTASTLPRPEDTSTFSASASTVADRFSKVLSTWFSICSAAGSIVDMNILFISAKHISGNKSPSSAYIWKKHGHYSGLFQKSIIRFPPNQNYLVYFNNICFYLQEFALKSWWNS